VQAVSEEQWTSRSLIFEAPGGVGGALDSADQASNRVNHFSRQEPLAALATVMHMVVVGQEIALTSPLKLITGGNVHSLPSQSSAKPSSVWLSLPTAMHIAEDAQETSSSRASSTGAGGSSGLGVDWRDQVSPSHDSPNVTAFADPKPA
jgi:hypothetical protein